MTHVCLAPDFLGPLGPQQLEGDRLHRRHRSELDESLRFGMAELAGSVGYSIETSDE
jgi:hypothetical protein